MLLPTAITSVLVLLSARLPDTCTKLPTVADNSFTETTVTPLASAMVWLNACPPTVMERVRFWLVPVLLNATVTLVAVTEAKPPPKLRLGVPVA